MRYVMSLDGGGTKLLCLIANENGMIVGRSTHGSVNSNYNSDAAVATCVRRAISGALEDGQTAPKDIACVYAALPAALPDLTNLMHNDLGYGVPVRMVTEFTMSLYGAIQERYGGLVQAGTGSFAEILTESETIRVGGWGALIGDEGSGTYIGRRSLTACVQMSDGRGPATSLKEKIFEAWEIEGDMEKLVIRIHTGDAARQRALIASLCPIVGRCAADGDSVARSILADAGKQLALQMAAALQRCNDSRNVAVTVGGGVWKTHPLVFQTFRSLLLHEFEELRIVTPRFEPAGGGLLLGLAELGVPVKERLGIYRDTFADYSLENKTYF